MTKSITQNKIKELFVYNPDTGIFTSKGKGRKYKEGDIAGFSDQDGYISIPVGYEVYKAHRLAWLYMEGYMPEYQIDHKNGVKGDNRWCNLRHATPLCNMQNRGKDYRNNSGFPGVRWNKKVKKWVSTIGINYNVFYIGSFSDPLEAALARFTVETQCQFWTCNYQSYLCKAIKASWPEFNPSVKGGDNAGGDTLMMEKRKSKKMNMTGSKFVKNIGVSLSLFSRALRGERNLSYDNATKVARKLKTGKDIWRNDGLVIARVAAWEAYCEKFNGGGK